MLHETLAIARKEFRSFFASPAAYIFIGGFLAVTLFIVFWVSAFFARDIADVAPMFQWMPVLMIFLAGALTMRVWSEERRAGTLETLMTTPVRPVSLVLGKFLAIEALVALALLLTLPLPVSVSFLGRLDWGPVIGGYVATLCLAAAYVSIGVFVSAQSDNPVISLIVTVLACAVFYFIGSDLLTALVSFRFADLLRELGSGSRFASITRGVLDARDLYYYLSLVGAFLALNVLQLHRLRWAGNASRPAHRVIAGITVLAVANLLAANFWLAPVTSARIDLTRTHRYTLSDATRSSLAGLAEPLVIRGYFSSKTHPLLAPLVPQLHDLLTEYAVAAGNKVRVEFLNPTTNPQAEKSAAEFGIRPTPFQTANRYSSSVVNSYFNIVVSYGDQYQVLGFQDLIEAKNNGVNNLQVGLANPEYAITSAIRKVTQAYRAGGNAFAAVPGGVTFEGYISPQDRLPQSVAPIRAALTKALDELKAKSKGDLKVAFTDPGADAALAKKLKDSYGLGPQIAGLLNPQPFWFSLMLQGDGRAVTVSLPDTGKLDAAAFKRAIDAAAKRLAPGFLRTVAVVKPGGAAPARMAPQTAQYTRLISLLGKTARVVEPDLSKGQVPADTDVLMVLDPTDLGDKARFAIDQFLMRGGSVVLATSPYGVDVGQTLSLRKQTSGLEDWLASYGIKIDDSLVLDPQNAKMPVPVSRNVGGLTLREIKMVPYPNFPDVRLSGLSQTSPITSALDQLTLNWPSPIELTKDMPSDLHAVKLVESSPGSWTSTSLEVTPDFKTYPSTGFAPGKTRAPRLMAVAVTGRFKSAFAGKDSPLLSGIATKVASATAGAADKAPKKPAGPAFAGVIDRSPAGAKLVVVSASTFADDLMLGLASQGLGTDYTAPVDFLQNATDWATEDPALLALRGQTRYANTLLPLGQGAQAFWEYLNYAMALIGLAMVWGWRRLSGRADRARYARIMNEVTA